MIDNEVIRFNKVEFIIWFNLVRARFCLQTKCRSLGKLCHLFDPKFSHGTSPDKINHEWRKSVANFSRSLYFEGRVAVRFVLKANSKVYLNAETLAVIISKQRQKKINIRSVLKIKLAAVMSVSIVGMIEMWHFTWHNNWNFEIN